MWLLRYGPVDWGWSDPNLQWEWWLKNLARKNGYFEPTNKFRLQLELAMLGDTVEEALEEARECVAEGGLRLSGIRATEVHLTKVAAVFDKDGRPRQEHSHITFEGLLEEVPAFPAVFEGPREAFFAALRAASSALGDVPLAVDAVQESPEYWFFPTNMIDCVGALYDRRLERALKLGSTYPLGLWIWGYERGLVVPDYAAGDLVITKIHVRERAKDFLSRCGVNEPFELPLIVPGAAMWMNILPLHEAGDALDWRVERT